MIHVATLSLAYYAGVLAENVPSLKSGGHFLLGTKSVGILSLGIKVRGHELLGIKVRGYSIARNQSPAVINP
jgi:hypothetical protein